MPGFLIWKEQKTAPIGQDRQQDFEQVIKQCAPLGS